MRGQVLSFDVASGVGQISGDDGQRYGFNRTHMRQQVTPWSGAAVDFVPQGADATDVFVLNNAAAHSYSGVAGSGDIDWAKLFFSPDGRIPRSRFWAAWGIMLAVGLFGGAIPFVGFVVQLGLIWSNICVYAKRLHDMGRSGWWMLAPMLLGVGTLVGGIVVLLLSIGGSRAGDTGAVIQSDVAIPVVVGLWGAYVLIYLGFLLWVGATPSEPRDNRFGPAPGQNVASTFD